MELIEFIKENFKLLIPILNVLGYVIKETDIIRNKYIPATLILVGISLALGINGVNMESVLQGILVGGTAVGLNQFVRKTN